MITTYANITKNSKAVEAIACVSVTPICQPIASNASHVYVIGLKDTGTASLPMGC